MNSLSHCDRNRKLKRKKLGNKTSGFRWNVSAYALLKFTSSHLGQWQSCHLLLLPWWLLSLSPLSVKQKLSSVVADWLSFWFTRFPRFFTLFDLSDLGVLLPWGIPPLQSSGCRRGSHHSSNIVTLTSKPGRASCLPPLRSDYWSDSRFTSALWGEIRGLATTSCSCLCVSSRHPKIPRMPLLF